MASSVNESNIKCSLIHLDNQQNQIQPEYTSKTIYKGQTGIYGLNSFREVSDWTNRCKIYDQFVKSQNSSSPQSHRKKILMNTIIPKRKNLSHECSKKQQLSISPINVRFRKQQKRNYRHEQKKIQFKIKQIPLSVYDSNFRSLSQRYHRQINPQKLRSKQHESDDPQKICSTIRESKFPKTEMISSIVRVMKKRQQMLSIRKKSIQQYQLNKNIDNQ